MTDGVRHGVPADADALAFIHAQAWQVAAEQGVISGRADTPAFHSNALRFRARLEQALVPTLVALRDANIVGYLALADCTLAGAAPAAVIDTMHVLPAHWYGRTATLLMTSAESWLQRHGFESLSISVRADNAEMQQFLHLRGFEMQRSWMRRGFLHTAYTLRLATRG